MINYVDKMADALVDVLKYSNQDVEWVEPDDMKPNDGVQPEWFYPAIENAEYSEITAILQYTQQEAVFEDEIGELMLGIALVEMKHYAHIRDAIVALGGTLPKPYDSKNVNIGETPVEALTLAAHSEVATIGFYKSVKERITASTPTADIARKLLTKLIADESLHLKLLTRQLKVMAGDDKKYDELMKKILTDKVLPFFSIIHYLCSKITNKRIKTIGNNECTRFMLHRLYYTRQDSYHQEHDIHAGRHFLLLCACHQASRPERLFIGHIPCPHGDERCGRHTERGH